MPEIDKQRRSPRDQLFPELILPWKGLSCRGINKLLPRMPSSLKIYLSTQSKKIYKNVYYFLWFGTIYHILSFIFPLDTWGETCHFFDVPCKLDSSTSDSLLHFFHGILPLTSLLYPFKCLRNGSNDVELVLSCKTLELKVERAEARSTLQKPCPLPLIST